MTDSPHYELAARLAERFASFPQVTAIGLGGSLAGGRPDAASDIDLYVFTTGLIPLAERQALVNESGAARADLNLRFWDLGDEWFDRQTGIEVDLMYWDTAWIADMLDRVLVRHEAGIGYTTCFWHTLRHMRSLYDRDGWLKSRQAQAAQPYPPQLRRAIIARNHPVLRGVIPAYSHQIEKALRRGDRVSLNHRVAALLASYFDVLFALNELPHPGEKRLLEIAALHCPRCPAEMAGQVNAVLAAAAAAGSDLPSAVEALLDGLDAVLLAAGFDPRATLALE